jgi:DNA-directed RNA polymerase subunit RPC12/RpoP
MTKSQLQEGIERGDLDKDGKPIQCPNCGSRQMFDESGIDKAGQVVERKRYCIKCGMLAGTWDHGAWL